MENKRRNERGFTLIEVMIAMGIFAIGFMALGLMQIEAMTGSNSARRTTEAWTIADDHVERLMAEPFFADDDFNIPADLINASNTAPHVDNIAGPYTVRWSVDDTVPLEPYEAGVFTPAALRRSCTIRLWVTRDTNPNDIEAEIQFVKFSRMDT